MGYPICIFEEDTSKIRLNISIVILFRLTLKYKKKASVLDRLLIILNWESLKWCIFFPRNKSFKYSDCNFLIFKSQFLCTKSFSFFSPWESSWPLPTQPICLIYFCKNPFFVKLIKKSQRKDNLYLNFLS